MSEIEEKQITFFDDEKGQLEVQNIDFGVVKRGETVKKDIWIKSHSKHKIINLEVKSNSPYLSVLGIESSELDPGAFITVHIEWKPPPNIKVPLKGSLVVVGYELIGGEKE